MGKQQDIMLAQQRIMAEQQSASVWPYVKTNTLISFDLEKGKTVINCTIENKGIGPAIINNIKLLFKEKYYNNYDDFAKSLKLDNLDKSGLLSFKISKKKTLVLKAGEEVTLFSFALDPTKYSTKDVVSINAQLQLCYCSVNNDCWRENGTELSDDYPCEIIKSGIEVD